ncbi:MAG: transposase [Bilifractor sp.]
MRINWRTVGNCIKAAHGRVEPNVSDRLHGLKRICVDETYYHKGHKYITVVYVIDRKRVAWLHEGYGQEIFKLFCEALTEKERDQIEVVAGNGVRRIDSCTKTYFRNARRYIDFFHVVSWINDALDRAKNGSRKAAEYRAALAEKETFNKRGRHTRRQAEVLTIIAIYEQQHASPEGKAQLSDVHQKILDEKKARVDELKHAKYALRMNPENLSEKLRDKLKIIEASHPDVYIAYQMSREKKYDTLTATEKWWHLFRYMTILKSIIFSSQLLED